MTDDKRCYRLPKTTAVERSHRIPLGPVASVSTSGPAVHSTRDEMSTKSGSGNTLFSGTSTSRLYLSKAARRAVRTVNTEARLFLARPLRRRPWTVPCLLVLACAVVMFVTARLLSTFAPYLLFIEPGREAHFTHDAHAFLPRPENFDTVHKRKCSWLYLEFGSKDGRHVDGFVNDGDHFLEEYLRASQSVMRAFCALAFEPDPAMSKTLNQVRQMRGRKTLHFDIFTQIVPGAIDDTEQLKFRDPQTSSFIDGQVPITSIALKQFVQNVTFPPTESGAEVNHMTMARGNGNKGSVILRFNQLSVREALWYLDMLEAEDAQGVMCKRVDRLILDFRKMRLKRDGTNDAVDDRDTERDWRRIITPPAHMLFSPSDNLSSVLQVAKLLNDMPDCRTTIHVIDESGKTVAPDMLSERAVFYAILAGQPTFNERIAAQTDTWMRNVPKDRVTIFTNERRSKTDMRAALDRDVAVVQPNVPSLEQYLSLMQSWSHLVRTRESWDRAMKKDASIKWLALVDDDTFVFPGAMREYLSSFDHRRRVWGGSGEQARIDNGDGGKFANWLRNIHVKHGGRHCYLRNETVPVKLEGYIQQVTRNGKKESRKISHMCHDTFCKIGCPAVPQGAAIFVSRALVEAVRPYIEECERDTSKLCKNCGSQRLFMCVNEYTRGASTLLMRGICRSPWKVEHREKFPFALTFHGFNRYDRRALSTDSLHGDMDELWKHGKAIQDDVDRGEQSSYLVPMAGVADLIACQGKGGYDKGWCHGNDGKKFLATDKPRKSHRVYHPHKNH